MDQKEYIAGFLHYRSDLGDGTQTGVVFSSCKGKCSKCCFSYRFLPEHPFAEDTKEKDFYTADQLVSYLKEEKTLCYTKELGIPFCGKEPLSSPNFCHFAGYGIKKAGMNFQVYTCADVPGYVFDKLFGVVDLYVIRLFSLRPKKHRPYPDYDLNRVLENISFLDRKKVPFRLLIPVLKGTNDTEAEKLALFAASLRSLKSVILDFTHSELNSEEEQNYRAAFLSKGVALY